MLDLQDSSNMTVPTDEDADATKHISYSEAQTPQQYLEQTHSGLGNIKVEYSRENEHEASDVELTPGGHQAKQEVALTDSEKADRIMSLLNSTPEHDEAIPEDGEAKRHPNQFDTNIDDTDIVIKQEVPDVELIWDTFSPTEIIELSDTEEVAPKVEDDHYEFVWASTPDDHISIADSDDEEEGAFVLLQDGRRMPIKKEKPDVLFTWADMGDRVIELDSDEEPIPTAGPKLGKSLLGRRITKPRRTPEEIKKMQLQIQRYREHHRAKEGERRPQAVPKAPHPHPSFNSNHNNDEDFAWMSNDYRIDENAGHKFKTLKKEYKAKLKAGTNTLQDDVDFKRAEKREQLRLERLKTEYEELCGFSDCESSEAEEEGEESLFVTPSPSRPLGSKRRIAAADEGNGGEDSNGNVRAKKPRTTGEPEQALFDADQEHYANMVAGIEDVLGKKFGGRKAEKAGKKSKDPKKISKGHKGDPKTPKRKKHKQGTITDIGSLLSGNLFDEATKANLDRDALPVSPEKKKAEALKS